MSVAFKHGWRQRKKWRDVKRTTRAAQRVAKLRAESIMRITYGRVDLSPFLRTFDTWYTQDTVEVQPFQGFQRYEPLGLPYVDFRIELMCTGFDYNHLTDYLATAGDRVLTVYRGDKKYLRCKAHYTTLTAGTSHNMPITLTLNLRSTGKVTQWMPF